MGGGCNSSEGAGWALEAAGQALEAAGWALDARCRASEAVVRVQRQLERLLRQLGVIFFQGGGAKSEVTNGLKQVNFMFKWANMVLRLHQSTSKLKRADSKDLGLYWAKFKLIQANLRVIPNNSTRIRANLKLKQANLKVIWAYSRNRTNFRLI